MQQPQERIKGVGQDALRGLGLYLLAAVRVLREKAPAPVPQMTVASEAKQRTYGALTDGFTHRLPLVVVKDRHNRQYRETASLRFVPMLLSY
jgi:hypothetical protein